MHATYFNELDPNASAWLRQLQADGLIEPGPVDVRSIRNVEAKDVASYLACHFFAGIGGWPYALELAGWPRERAVWTGSCPCPPFSSAGRKKRCPACGERPIPCPRRTGTFICVGCEHTWIADERHLWPEFWRLIRDCRPPVVFGEQVAGSDGLIWLAGVRASLEALGYRVGCADLCSAGEGSPNIRQRLFWVADSGGQRWERRPDEQRSAEAKAEERGEEGIHAERSRSANRMGHTHGRRSPTWEPTATRTRHGNPTLADGDARRVANTESPGGVGHPGIVEGTQGQARASCDRREDGTLVECGRTVGRFWDDFDIVHCSDDKSRRIEPGSFPLASGVPARVVRLRGYGNAINPWVAAKFIRAYRELS